MQCAYVIDTMIENLTGSLFGNEAANQHLPPLTCCRWCSNWPCGLRGNSDACGFKEIQMLAAFAKDQMKKTHSVRLSDMEPSQWDYIRKNAGIKS